ncbi:MAG TPA: DUF1800 domain-containing protein [Mycobacteriales bacterium]|nr:DUF1800 domain-containing protein [Mycobacteriales bacterium]
MTGAAVVAASATGTQTAWAAPAHHKHRAAHHHDKPSAVAHLLRRATYGATPELAQAVEKQGMTAWLEDQLHPGRVPDHAMDELLKRWPSLKWNTWQVHEHLSDGAWDVMFDLVDTHIARAIWSKRQLLEIMVDFWSNHLNVTCPSSDVWDSRHLFDREVIRKHAFGRFSDMLCDTGRAPAMLNYLGNAESTGAAPNENWGRELLELHTVGIQAGYSQKDVHNSALILTGLSVEPDGGQFEYKPWMHYVGHVKVMGFHSANHSATKGEQVAMAYLRYLAHHPSTARHIATKLVTRFVCDEPPRSLVDRLAATYRRNGTAIVPVLRELFASHEFAHSVNEKVRTPYEDFVATLRLLRIGPPHKGTAAVRDLQWLTSTIGQPPLGWHAPNGYADTAASWASTSATLGKWNLHVGLAGQWWPQKLRYTKLDHFVPKPLPATHGRLVDALASSLNVPKLNTVQRAAITAFVDEKPSSPLAAGDAAVTWRLPYLVALVLDSSHQALR